MNKKQVIKYVILTILFYSIACIIVSILAWSEGNHYVLGIAGVLFGWMAHIGSTVVEPMKEK